MMIKALGGPWPHFSCERRYGGRPEVTLDDTETCRKLSANAQERISMARSAEKASEGPAEGAEDAEKSRPSTQEAATWTPTRRTWGLCSRARRRPRPLTRQNAPNTAHTVSHIILARPGPGPWKAGGLIPRCRD